jgi:hypothetical protein
VSDCAEMCAVVDFSASAMHRSRRVAWLAGRRRRHDCTLYRSTVFFASRFSPQKFRRSPSNLSDEGQTTNDGEWCDCHDATRSIDRSIIINAAQRHIITTIRDHCHLRPLHIIYLFSPASVSKADHGRP